MSKTLHLKTTVTRRKNEIVDQGLPVGESVDVVVRHSPAPTPRSAVDVLAELQANSSSKRPRMWTDYIKEERASWDR